MDTSEATRLLERFAAGDRQAADLLLPLVYAELRRQAARAMGGERADHTLQPTALVHEAYLRLFDAPASFESRAHFVRVAARAMRNVLVDHARARGAQKRGDGRERVALDGVLAAYEERDLDVLALHEALERLLELDEPLGRLVELRFFAGLSIAQTAEVLGSSTATVERHWRVARLWLRRELGAAPEPAGDSPDS
jgi:RNA polymerase sigma factor (TIGR02999 family)